MSIKTGFICFIVVLVAIAGAMPANENYPCPMMYSPVCGSDGNNYPNAICMTNKDSTLTVKHPGYCEGTVEFVPR